MDVLVTALGGEVAHGHGLGSARAAGRGRASRCCLTGAAVVEMAQASGLSLVRRGRAGRVGGIHARHGRADRGGGGGGRLTVIVTVGGSATTDGGAGAVEASREAGVSPELQVVCDVRVPFEDAPRVFGPQKGADPAMVERLERRLDELAASFPRDPRGVPMTGAAGGLSGGLWARSAPRSCRAPPTCSTRSASTP